MKSSKNIPALVWIISSCCVAIIFISSFRLFYNLELATYDLRFNLRPPQKISDTIVIINIDDSTLNNLGRWPLPRDFHASLVDVLSEFGAKAVVFDMLFSESTDYDKAFAESMMKAKNVYLPLVFDITEKHNVGDLPYQSTPVLDDITPLLKQSARSIGHMNAIANADGKYRMVPLFVRSDDGLVPQLTFKAACD